MLSLQLKSGDYLTIDSDIVIQVFRNGNQIQVSIQAPREMPIARGKVLERDGQPRPSILHSRPTKSPADRRHAARQLEKYAARREAKLAALAEAVPEDKNVLLRKGDGKDAGESA